MSQWLKHQEDLLENAERLRSLDEQMVSPVNAEIALKSLMDAELALTKARDLLRRSRSALMNNGYTAGDEAIIADIHDLLGD